MKLFAKIDKFAVENYKIFTGLSAPLILGALAIAFFTLHEYYVVGIKKMTEGYPWGCKCFPGMENYSSPTAYSNSMLLFSMTSILVILIYIYSIKKKRALYSFVITVIYIFYSGLQIYLSGENIF